MKATITEPQPARHVIPMHKTPIRVIRVIANNPLREIASAHIYAKEDDSIHTVFYAVYQGRDKAGKGVSRGLQHNLSASVGKAITDAGITLSKRLETTQEVHDAMQAVASLITTDQFIIVG